jgi:Mannosyltransferase (PIG-V)
MKVDPVDSMDPDNQPASNGERRQGSLTPHEPSVDRPSGRATARRAVSETLPIYVASRLVVFFIARATLWLHPQLTLTQGLSAWDGGWYLAIAERGYVDQVQGAGDAGLRWAFLPGFPLLVRGVAEVTGLSLPVSGIVLSITAGAAAMVVIWIIVADVLGETVATSTAALMAFFPTSYVLSMVYTEGVFLLLAAVGLYAAIKRRWLLGGAMAAAACLVRIPGLTLVAVLVVTALVELRRGRGSWRMLAGLLLSLTGIMSWLLYQQIRVGSFKASRDAQRIGWYNEFRWFSTPVRSTWRVLTDRGTWSEGTEVLGALAFGLVLACAALAVGFARRHRNVVPIEWWAYSIVSIAFTFSPYWPSSLLRYTFAAFPLFAVAIAQLPKRLLTPVLCVSASAMAVLCSVAIGGVVDFQHAPFAP